MALCDNRDIMVAPGTLSRKEGASAWYVKQTEACLACPALAWSRSPLCVMLGPEQFKGLPSCLLPPALRSGCQGTGAGL